MIKAQNMLTEPEMPNFTVLRKKRSISGNLVFYPNYTTKPMDILEYRYDEQRKFYHYLIFLIFES